MTARGRRFVQAALVGSLLLACLPIFSQEVSAINSLPPTIQVVSGNPSLGATSSKVKFDVTNPAVNAFTVNLLKVVPPSGWGLSSCTPGVSGLDVCGLSGNATYTGGLVPGASTFLGMDVVSPPGPYPLLGNFTTVVRDASSNLTYPGRAIILKAIDPSTTVNLTPLGTTPYIAGLGPWTVKVDLSPPQSGVPVVFSLSGYRVSDTYTISPNSTVSDASGATSAAFTPSQRNGATAVVTARLGSSNLTGSTGPFVTLSPGPSINLSPGSGTVGTAVTLSGAGFLAGGVQVTFGNLTVANFNVNSSGSQFGAMFLVPSVPFGSYRVTASGQGGLSASVSFAVIAAGPPPFDFTMSLSSNDSAVGPGQDFTTTVSMSVVFGTPGFVSLSVSSLSGVGVPTLSSSGGFPPFLANLSGKAPLASGTYTYLMSAGSGNVTHEVRYSIMVPQSVFNLSTSSAPPGTSVNVTGSNFPPSSRVSISFGASLIANVTTNPDGTFQTAIIVPGVSPGNYNVIVAGGAFPLSSPLAVVGTASPIFPPWVYAGIGGAAVAGAIGWGALRILNVPEPTDPKFSVAIEPGESVTEEEEEGR